MVIHIKEKKVIQHIVMELYNKQLIKFGEYRLSSGKNSPYYIDLRTLPSYPMLYREIMELLVEKIKSSNIDFDVIAGIETSGIVHASYLGCIMNKPIAYIRKKVKEHGTRKLVEGIVENKNVLLVDDVSTTGTTLYNAVQVLRKHEAIVKHAFVIIDRCEGAREKLSELNVELKPLITIHDIIDVLKKHRLVSNSILEKIIQYLQSGDKV